MLWKRSLVMYDQETDSHWSHLLGKAMDGQLKGQHVAQIPSVMTDWKTWRKQHPDTSVLWLSPSSDAYRRDFYQEPDLFVLGYAASHPPRAWTFDWLMKNPVTNQTVQQEPVVVTFDAKSMTARLFSRKLEDAELEFELRDGELFDRGSQSTWDLLSGKCVRGALAKKYLTALPAIVSYHRSWMRFHPNTKVEE